MKVAFLGTPQFAVPCLEALTKSKHRVVCAVTQPDEKCGRGQKLTECPVKRFALAHNIPVLQAEKISREADKLAAFKPDIIVTCAFGQILRQSVLDIAPVINVHGSLLPKYRGAAPIQWAVINGDRKTGITIAKTELGLDCGAIIEQIETEIMDTETGGELFERLSILGAELLIKALDKIENGTAVYTPQDDSLATAAPMLNKEMAHINWAESAAKIANLVRGLNPSPIAYFLLDGNPVRVYGAAAALCGEKAWEKAKCGTVIIADKRGLFVACGSGILRIDELQIAGRRRMSTVEFLNGKKIAVGTVLG